MSQSINLIRNDERTRFIPINPNTSFIERMIKESEIDYGEFNELIKNSNIKIGLEFEFYLNKEQNPEKLFSSILAYGKELVFCPTEYNTKNKDLNAWTIERDGTLMNPLKNGFEIVSPVLDTNSAPFFLKNILKIIRMYGHTDYTCGLHFHISSTNENLNHFDASKLMLLLDKNNVLSHWKNRSGTNKEIIDVFNKTKWGEFNKEFKNISRTYTIVPRSEYGIKNHLEVRAMGGEKYEFKEKEILEDFKKFVNLYAASCNPTLMHEQYHTLASNFISNSINNKKAITLENLVEEACKLNKDFDSLSKRDKIEFLEVALFNLEDALEFVPTKKLLLEIEDYVNNKNSHCEEILQNIR